MNFREKLEGALRLRAKERSSPLGSLIGAPNESDYALDAIWADEAERRLNAYREGRLEGIPMEEIFKDSLR